MSENYNETYEVIVLMAKVKMKMNSHKGNIEDLSAEQLISSAKDELDELYDSIVRGKNQTHIIEEAADVLNYAVAAAHKAIKLYRGRK